jgi:hypothetical protein
MKTNDIARRALATDLGMAIIALRETEALVEALRLENAALRKAQAEAESPDAEKID